MLQRTHLCVSALWHSGFCEASVLSVQHLLLQLRGHALGKVPVRVVGVLGERAEGAAPEVWEEDGNGDQQNTHFKCHQVWNLFLLMQWQGWHVCAASIGDKAVVCPGTYNEWGFLKPCHCWCWQLCTAGASWVAAPSLSCQFFNHSVN